MKKKNKKNKSRHRSLDEKDVYGKDGLKRKRLKPVPREKYRKLLLEEE